MNTVDSKQKANKQKSPSPPQQQTKTSRQTNKQTKTVFGVKAN